MRLSGPRRALRNLILIAALVVTPVVSAADRGRMNDLGDQLMCMCGCGQLLGRCNHTNCPKSVPMLKELATHIDGGETSPQILAAFVDKYGTAVKSNGGGLGKIAMSVAFAMLLAGGIVAVGVVLRWKRANAQAIQAAGNAPAAAAISPDYRNRIEEDLKRLTPED